jgi:hypothetical protein
VAAGPVNCARRVILSVVLLPVSTVGLVSVFGRRFLDHHFDRTNHAILIEVYMIQICGRRDMCVKNRRVHLINDVQQQYTRDICTYVTCVYAHVSSRKHIHVATSRGLYMFQRNYAIASEMGIN